MVEGVLLGSLLFVFLIPLAVAVVMIVGMYKMFEKANVEGWKAIIPVYDIYVLVTEVAKLNWWWFLIIILGGAIPIVGTIAVMFAYINLNYTVAKRFGGDEGTIVLTCIFSGIMYCVFGFGQAKYSDAKMSANGLIKDDLSGFEGTASSASSTSKATGDGGFCTHCGAALNKGDKFCQTCGNEIK